MSFSVSGLPEKHELVHSALSDTPLRRDIDAQGENLPCVIAHLYGDERPVALIG